MSFFSTLASKLGFNVLPKQPAAAIMSVAPAVKNSSVYIPAANSTPSNASSISPTGQIISPTSAPTTISSGSGLSAKDQAAVQQAYAQGMGGGGGSVSAPTTMGASSFEGGVQAINIPSAGGSIGGAGASNITGSGGNALLMNNAALTKALGMDYTYDPSTGIHTYSAKEAALTPEEQASKKQEDLFQQYLGKIPKEQNVYNTPEVLQQQEQVNQKRAVAQGLTNQLNTITAEANANALSTIGQGRGIPEAIIGGQQAQIYREAAIRALPIQAQLSAAQGDLELSQNYLTQMVQMKSAEIQASFSYQTKLMEAVYNHGNKQQQAVIDGLNQQKRDDFTRQTDAINYAESVAMEALNSGNVAAFGGITKLLSNPSSATFMNDVAALAGQITPASKTSTGQPSTAVVNTLVSSGLSQDEIAHIDSGVKTNGFQSVYDAEKAAGASPEKLSALQKAYGVTPTQTKDDVAKDMKSLFTTDELHTMAKDLGYASFWTGADTDIQRMFDNATMEQLVRKLAENIK